MKKTLKIVLLVAFMLLILFSLTGCGNKLIATRETEGTVMEMKEKIEFSFKGDKVNKVKRTCIFEDKEAAESMKALLDLGISMLEEQIKDCEIKQSGKKVTMELDAEAFMKLLGKDIKELSREELKEQLEEEGYKVK